MSYTTKIDAKDIISTVRDHLIGDGFEFVLDLEKSQGSYMIDKLTGKRILDFYTCFASNPLGFNHPKMTDANTLAKLTTCAVNNVTNSDLFTEFKAEFVKTCFEKAAPSYMKYMFNIAGGSLAVENAMKAAFDWKAQKNYIAGDTYPHELSIMHFKHAFHGRSGYTMSVTNTDPSKTDLFPKFNWPRIENAFVKFPDEGALHEDTLRREKLALDQAKNLILSTGNTIAALLIEPIQGEGGDNHFRTEFLQELQALCNENNILFIVDEVQSGMGITGKMWAHEHHDLTPDILCYGKKAQVCGVLAGDRMDEIEHHVFNTSGRINSTWGGNLVDMVRCQRYLEIYEEDNLVENAANMGAVMLKGLQEIAANNPGFISNPRGKGLFCAFDVVNAAKRNEIRQKCYENNMLILPCGTRSLRFRPAMCIQEADVLKAMNILGDVVAKAR